VNISASNYYTHENNTPNFKSNIMATPKYYTYNEGGRARGGPYYEHFENITGAEEVGDNEEPGVSKRPERTRQSVKLLEDTEPDVNSASTNAWLEADNTSTMSQTPDEEVVSSMKDPVEKFTSFQSPRENTSDTWEYSNELAMNGGNLGIQGMNVFGNQSLNSMYAPIGSTNTVLDGCDPYSSKNMRDDIRFGMGLGNEKNMLQR
jgi:hypothetical protein